MGENPNQKNDEQRRQGPGQTEPMTQPDKSTGSKDKDLGQGRKASDEDMQKKPGQDMDPNKAGTNR
jgi:hypothetical protein